MRIEIYSHRHQTEPHFTLSEPGDYGIGRGHLVDGRRKLEIRRGRERESEAVHTFNASSLSNLLSRVHAVLEYDGTSLYLTATGTNKTVLAGREMPNDERTEVLPGEHLLELTSEGLLLKVTG